MEVKPGYKRTEVGVIPEDWEVVRVADLAAAGRNAIVGGPFGSDLTSGDYVEDGVPVIRGQNMGSPFLTGPFVCVSKKKAALLQANLAGPGDLVFTQRGTLGQVSLVPAHAFPSYVVSQSQMKVTVDGKAYDSSFYYYAFCAPQVQELIRQSTIQTSLPHINLGILRSIPVPRPMLQEQVSITAALRDADALIQSLESWIAKKRQIKQGAMQELLTGKRRLPGFSGPWRGAPLGELADVRNGGTPSTSQPAYWNGDIPWCTPSDVTALKGYKFLTGTNRRITREGLAASAADILPPRSVVMTSRATIGECAINTVPMTTNQGFKTFVPTAHSDVEFLYYRLLTEKSRLVALSGGSTFLEIGKSELSAVEVKVPPTLPEQLAIAAVLSDMDAEIDALEAKVAKARQLKQGMMQELLTGRIRLV